MREDGKHGVYLAVTHVLRGPVSLLSEPVLLLANLLRVSNVDDS